jgi:hypothetical protein
MTLKLEEFRLESYDERLVLVLALGYYQQRCPDMYPEAAKALAKRLSSTQCQLGGCQYCGGPIEDDWS